MSDILIDTKLKSVGKVFCNSVHVDGYMIRRGSACCVFAADKDPISPTRIYEVLILCNA